MSQLALQVPASNRDGSQAGSTAENSATGNFTKDGYGGTGFTSVTIAKNSWIARATLETYCIKTLYNSGKTTIYAQAADNAGTFGTTTNNISTRSRTTASVAWTVTSAPTGWNSAPDVAALIQEVVTRTSWASGNALNLIWVNDTAYNTYGYGYYTYDFSTGQYAPKLTIDYFAPSNASLAQGNVPNGISITTTVGTPTVTPGAVTASPSGIAGSTALGTATVTPGAVTTSLSGIAGSTTVGTVTVSQTTGGQTATLDGVGITIGLGSATVTLGAVTASPAGINTTTAAGTVTIAVGTVTASVAGIAVTITIGDSHANLLPAARNLEWIPLAPATRWTSHTPAGRWTPHTPNVRWSPKGPAR